MAVVAGNITEALDIVDWRVTATKCKDGTLSGTTLTSGATYSVTCADTDPVNVTLAPKIDYQWSAAKSVLVNDYVVAASPDTTPHIWKATTAPDGDANYANVGLLLHCDGTNGSTTFTDSSPSPKTVTVYGNAQISTAQSQWGGASALFDGTGDYLTAPITLNIRTDIYTMECWIRPTSVASDQGIFCGTGFYLEFYAGSIYVGDSSVNYLVVASHGITANTWQHVALTFDGTTTRLFVGGVLKGSSGTLPASVALSTLEIGVRVTQGIYFAGNMDDIRITKGVARYTADFTPPAAAFLGSAATGATEPTWSLSGTTADNGITWTYVAPLVDPVTIGPKIPA